MKNTFHLPKVLTIALVALVMASPAVAQQMIEGSATVVRIVGSARYAAADNVWHPLREGYVLRPGATIQTAERSRVDIVLNDPDARPSETVWGELLTYQPPVAEQNFVRLWENTVLSIDRLLVADTGASRITETQLDLKTGRIFGTVRQVTAASKYEVRIPNAVAGVRGTIYSISADGVIQALVGSVVVAHTDAAGNVVTQVIVGGQQLDIRTGQITPLPDIDRLGMMRIGRDARIAPPPPPTTFVQDVTTHYVSPRQGFIGDNGNNGNNAGF